MQIKKKWMLTLICFVVFTIAVTPKVYAENIEKTENYSKKYQEWLELSEEERAKTIAPLPFNVRSTGTKKNSKFLNLLQSAVLPSKFDLRDKIDIEVKDQMQTGSCWTFSANSVLETNLALNGEEYQFSERHLEYNTSDCLNDGKNNEALNRKIGNGGDNLTAFT